MERIFPATMFFNIPILVRGYYFNTIQPIKGSIWSKGVMQFSENILLDEKCVISSPEKCPNESHVVKPCKLFTAHKDIDFASYLVESDMANFKFF